MDKVTFQLTFKPETQEEIDIVNKISKMGRKKSKFILSTLLDKNINLDDENVNYEKIRQIIREELSNFEFNKIDNTIEKEENITKEDDNTDLLLSGLSAFGDFGD